MLNLFHDYYGHFILLERICSMTALLIIRFNWTTLTCLLSSPANGKCETFKMVFPLDQRHNSLALIGNIAGDSALAPLYEQQARLATLVMAGKHRLPPRHKMKQDIDFWNANNLARRGNFQSYFITTSMLIESIAHEIGCYPAFWKVFVRDPILAFRNWYGPMYSAQYRLIGPDSQWEEAARTCRQIYKEPYSSIRRIEASHLHRPDAHDYQKSTIIRLIFLLSMPAASLLIFKYQNSLWKTLFDA